MSLSITERSLERKKELDEFLTRNFQLGKGSKAQILSTKADLENLWPVIIKARQDLRTAKKQLCVLMGRQMTDTIQLDTASTLQSVLSLPLPSKEDAVKTALNDRSDLQSIDYLRKANDGGVKIFKANYLPSIVGQFSLGTRGIKPQDLVDLDTRDWKAGIAMQWTMFDGFASSAKASQYRSDSRKLQIAKSSFTKFIEIEIEDALTNCFVADSNLPASKIVFAAAQEAYDLNAENFKQGDGQFAELQLAEERLRQSEMGVMNARYLQIRSRAALLVAMGRTIIPTEGK
jgi:outer membrane protein TolC